MIKRNLWLTIPYSIYFLQFLWLHKFFIKSIFINFWRYWPFFMILLLGWWIIQWSKIWKRFVHSRTGDTLELFWFLFEHSTSISMSKDTIPIWNISWFGHSTVSLSDTVSWSILTRSRNFSFLNRKIYLLISANLDELLGSNLFAFDDSHLLMQYFPSGFMLSQGWYFPGPGIEIELFLTKTKIFKYQYFMKQFWVSLSTEDLLGDVIFLHIFEDQEYFCRIEQNFDFLFT